MTFSTAIAGAQGPPSREYQLKAVFLFNFTQFVNWPPTAFDSEKSSLVIGVIGENPFGSFLEETVAGEKVGEHAVVVRHFKNVSEITDCHILFINIRDGRNRTNILDQLKGKNILTVSDAADFNKQGGMIRLFTKTNKIKLQVNMDATRQSELELSSKLLRLAEIYKPG
jgi:hypothetical protein